jgi:arsenate reductase
MKNKIYHLASCSTCQRIIKSLNDGAGFILQDIKSERITSEQLDEMQEKAGSYEAVFSRRALKYRALGLHEKQLSEPDYRDLILQEYTFLSRPVIFINGKIFVGNSKKNVDAAMQALGIT